MSGLLWRKYKFFILSLILLIAFIFVVGQVHIDYLRYNDRQAAPGNVGISFAVKWAVWALSIFVFLAANHYFNQYKKQQKQANAGQSNSALKKILKWKDGLTDKNQDPVIEQEQIKTTKKRAEGSAAGDPFENIRKKKKLRSYADIIIEQKPNKKSDG